MNKLIRSMAGVFAVGAMVAACSTPDTAAVEAALNNASDTVNRASSDPNVAKYAPDQLAKAQDSLKYAQTTWSEKQNDADATNWAYIAHQQASAALEIGKRGAAADSFKMASAERDTMMASAIRSAAQNGISVQFAFNDAKVPSDSMTRIDRFAAVLKAHPDRKVVLEAHTDSVGNSKYNKKLSMKRADSVRTALVDRGIDANRIVVQNFGEQYPVANNTTEGGRQENRRVDIAMADEQGNVAQSRAIGETTSVGSSGTRGKSKSGAK